MPEVSIITPLFNGQRFIEETILSVQNQSFQDWEMIIVDDCSTDSSLKVIEPFLSDQRIKVINLDTNGGVANARNAGISEANGRFISFLDSDDMWHPEKLTRQVSFMKNNSYSMSHTSYKKVDSSGRVLSEPISVSKSVSYSALLKHNEIGCLTLMYDAEKLDDVRFESIGHEDYACWLKILKTGIKSYGLDDSLAFYRLHSNTISSNKIKAAGFTWNIYRNVENFDIFKSSYYFLHYFFFSLRKFLK